MKYLLTMYVDPEIVDALPADERDALFSGQDTFMKTIEDSGEMAGTLAVAEPAECSTVRVRDGEAHVSTGLFVESKAQLCGFYLVGCESAERARQLAAQLPDARYTAVEVRPVVFEAGLG